MIPKFTQLTNSRFWFILSYQIGNILSVHPWYDFEEESFIHRTFNKIYVTICGSLLMGFFLISEFENTTGRNTVDNILCTIHIMLCIILVVCFIFGSCYWQQSTWKNYLKSLTQAVNFINQTGNRSYYYMYTAIFCIGHFLFFSVAGIIIQRLPCDVIITKIPALIFQYFCVLFIIIANFTLLIIHNNYELLLKLLKQKNIFSNQIYDTLDNDKKINNFILKIGRQYMRVSELVQYFNVIEGPKLIIIFMNTIIHLLRSYNFMMRSQDVAISSVPVWEYSVIMFLMTAAVMVSTY